MTFEVLVWNVFRQSVVYSYHWLLLLAINTVFHLNILRWAKVNSMQHFIGHKQMHSTLHCDFDELQCRFSTYVQRCSGIFCFVLFCFNDIINAVRPSIEVDHFIRMLVSFIFGWIVWQMLIHINHPMCYQI